MITLGRSVCGQYGEASEREWLETNGRGSYAMGTVCGANTRRYHSLLTVALPDGKSLFQSLNRTEESFFSDGARVELSCQAYPNAIHPQGHQFLEEFRLDPYPIWTYSFGATRLEKSFFLRYGDDAAVVMYKLFSGSPLTLEVRPLLTHRDHHTLAREDERFLDTIEISPHVVRVAAPNGPPLFLCTTEGEFHTDGFWYLNQEYERERRRAMDYREDTYSPGAFRFDMSPGHHVALVASLEERNSRDAAEWARQEKHMRRQIIEKAPVAGPLAESLANAADSFIVLKDASARIVSGYPWNASRARDAFISLPGLCLATGRAREAAEILENAASSVDKFLAPAANGHNGNGVHFDAEALLWYLWSAQGYLKSTDDEALIKRLLPSLRAFVDAFQHGRLSGVRMEEDGLIHCDAGGAQRGGKSCDIQALWYNALQFLAEMDLRFKETSRGYDKLAQVARTSFNDKFWNEPQNYLYNLIDGKDRDASIRPAALLAISLPYEILEQKYFKPLMTTAWGQLYTPSGLRALAPEDAARPENKYSNDDPPPGAAAPWLLGRFITGFVKAFGASDATKEEVQKFLKPFDARLNEQCLGFVPEFFEEDPPQAALGPPAPAVSIGELLRVIWEEKLVL